VPSLDDGEPSQLRKHPIRPTSCEIRSYDRAPNGQGSPIISNRRLELGWISRLSGMHAPSLAALARGWCLVLFCCILSCPTGTLQQRCAIKVSALVSNTGECLLNGARPGVALHLRGGRREAPPKRRTSKPTEAKKRRKSRTPGSSAGLSADEDGIPQAEVPWFPGNDDDYRSLRAYAAARARDPTDPHVIERGSRLLSAGHGLDEDSDSSFEKKMHIPCPKPTRGEPLVAALREVAKDGLQLLRNDHAPPPADPLMALAHELDAGGVDFWGDEAPDPLPSSELPRGAGAGGEEELRGWRRLRAGLRGFAPGPSLELLEALRADGVDGAWNNASDTRPWRPYSELFFPGAPPSQPTVRSPPPVLTGHVSSLFPVLTGHVSSTVRSPPGLSSRRRRRCARARRASLSGGGRARDVQVLPQRLALGRGARDRAARRAAAGA
jgi:hypothetical protein